MTQRATLLYKEAEILGHGGPCGPIALSILTDQAYLDAVKLCEARGHNATKGDGLKTTTMLAILHELGYAIEDVTDEARQLGGKTIQSVGWLLREGNTDFSKGKLLIQTRDHFAAVRDGIIHDWSSGRKMHVVRLYRIGVLA